MGSMKSAQTENIFHMNFGPTFCWYHHKIWKFIKELFFFQELSRKVLMVCLVLTTNLLLLMLRIIKTFLVILWPNFFSDININLLFLLFLVKPIFKMIFPGVRKGWKLYKRLWMLSIPSRQFTCSKSTAETPE